jgi:hypothetical protein
VRLYGEGYPEKEIEQFTGCNRTSLKDWSLNEWVAIERNSAGCINTCLHNDWGEKPSTAAGQSWTVEGVVVLVREQ